MRINCFSLTGSAAVYTDAITEVMALFSVFPAAVPVFSPDKLADNMLLVEILPEEEPTRVIVTTAVYYRLADNCIERRIFQNSASRLEEDHPETRDRLVRLNILAALRQLTDDLDAMPWGLLRGIRPGKLVHRLLDQGYTEVEAAAELSRKYGLVKEKARLITTIALRQRRFLLPAEQARRAVSVYIGIPFCPSRCLYCSFPSYVLPGRQEVATFLQSLTREIRLVEQLLKQYQLTVQNVYVGGGTPTSLENRQFSQMLDLVQQAFVTPSTTEFTVEAGRPDSVDDEKILMMHRLGVTRVSVNPQTMQEKTLKRIGRKHTPRDIISLFGKFRQAGFPVINMDVIVGLPGENEADITNTLQQIGHLQPDNLTIHTLAVKRASLLKNSVMEADLPTCAVTRNMFAIATAFALEMKLEPYYLYRQKHMRASLENVGYAKPGMECSYNIQMMEERQTVFGIGPAATTKVVSPAGWSLKNRFNAKDPATYANKIDDYHHDRCRLLKEAFAD